MTAGDGRILVGDCLAVMAGLDAASVDLVYMDPPFNTGRLQMHEAGAFGDRWTRAAAELVDPSPALAAALDAARICHGRGMANYLAFMAARVREARRLLAATGTLYLHCSPVAAAYLKVVLDAIFGSGQFRNEISWPGYPGRNYAVRNFANTRDVILRYSASDRYTFNRLLIPHDEAYLERAYCHRDPDGRRYRLSPVTKANRDEGNLNYEFRGQRRTWRWTRERMLAAEAAGRIVQRHHAAPPMQKVYLDEGPAGKILTNDWPDIALPQVDEHRGYPTQKPLALLDRIVAASSNRGELVLDPFCGSGTTLVAARNLERRWIGIDQSEAAAALARERLAETLL